jgi:hypothetical protein
MIRFSVRDVLWAMAVIGLILAWQIDRSILARKFNDCYKLLGDLQAGSERKSALISHLFGRLDDLTKRRDITKRVAEHPDSSKN